MSVITTGCLVNPSTCTMSSAHSICSRQNQQATRCPASSANMGWCSNAGSMLGQRRRQWPNIEPTLVDFYVFVAPALNTVGLGKRYIKMLEINHCIITYTHNLLYTFSKLIIFCSLL